MNSGERSALGVIALMLSVGLLTRVLGPGPEPGVWEGSAAADTAGAILAAQVSAEAAREERRTLPLREGERIDPNTASADELVRLPRVGPALAGRIVEWRTVHGPFRTLADLQQVRGIGPRLVERLAPLVQVAP